METSEEHSRHISTTGIKFPEAIKEHLQEEICEQNEYEQWKIQILTTADNIIKDYKDALISAPGLCKIISDFLDKPHIQSQTTENNYSLYFDETLDFVQQIEKKIEDEKKKVEDEKKKIKKLGKRLQTLHHTVFRYVSRVIGDISIRYLVYEALFKLGTPRKTLENYHDKSDFDVLLILVEKLIRIYNDIYFKDEPFLDILVKVYYDIVLKICPKISHRKRPETFEDFIELTKADFIEFKKAIFQYRKVTIETKTIKEIVENKDAGLYSVARDLFMHFINPIKTKKITGLYEEFPIVTGEVKEFKDTDFYSIIIDHLEYLVRPLTKKRLEEMRVKYENTEYNIIYPVIYELLKGLLSEEATKKHENTNDRSIVYDTLIYLKNPLETINDYKGKSFFYLLSSYPEELLETFCNRKLDPYLFECALSTCEGIANRMMQRTESEKKSSDIAILIKNTNEVRLENLRQLREKINSFNQELTLLKTDRTSKNLLGIIKTLAPSTYESTIRELCRDDNEQNMERLKSLALEAFINNNNDPQKALEALIDSDDRQESELIILSVYMKKFEENMECKLCNTENLKKLESSTFEVLVKNNDPKESNLEIVSQCIRKFENFFMLRILPHVPQNSFYLSENFVNTYNFTDVKDYLKSFSVNFDSFEIFRKTYTYMFKPAHVEECIKEYLQTCKKKFLQAHPKEYLKTCSVDFDSFVFFCSTHNYESLQDYLKEFLKAQLGKDVDEKMPSFDYHLLQDFVEKHYYGEYLKESLEKYLKEQFGENINEKLRSFDFPSFEDFVKENHPKFEQECVKPYKEKYLKEYVDKHLEIKETEYMEGETKIKIYPVQESFPTLLWKVEAQETSQTTSKQPSTIMCCLYYVLEVATNVMKL